MNDRRIEEIDKFDSLDDILVKMNDKSIEIMKVMREYIED